MTPHERFNQLYRITRDLTPLEFYMKSLLDGLYERSTVSNISYPTLLPAWDDAADIENIIKAMETLILDFKQIIKL